MQYSSNSHLIFNNSSASSSCCDSITTCSSYTTDSRFSNFSSITDLLANTKPEFQNMVQNLHLNIPQNTVFSKGNSPTSFSTVSSLHNEVETPTSCSSHPICNSASSSSSNFLDEEDEDDDEEEDCTNTLFVGDLASKCTAIKLRELFSRFGNVEQVRLVVNKNNSTHLKYGFVRMVTKEDADNARLHLNEFFFLGRKLRVSPANKKNKINNKVNNTSIILTNNNNTNNNDISISNNTNINSNNNKHTPPSVLVSFKVFSLFPPIDEVFLTDLLKDYGNVIDSVINKHEIKKILDPQFGHLVDGQIGYGFVHFEDTDNGILSTFRAVENSDEKKINNVLYKCKLSNKFIYNCNSTDPEILRKISLHAKSNEENKKKKQSKKTGFNNLLNMNSFVDANQYANNNLNHNMNIQNLHNNMNNNNINFTQNIQPFAYHSSNSNLNTTYHQQNSTYNKNHNSFYMNQPPQFNHSSHQFNINHNPHQYNINQTPIQCNIAQPPHQYNIAQPSHQYNIAQTPHQYNINQVPSTSNFNIPNTQHNTVPYLPPQTASNNQFNNYQYSPYYQNPNNGYNQYTNQPSFQNKFYSSYNYK